MPAGGFLMRASSRFLLLVPALVFVSTLAVRAQDEPSLGDVARQSRQQKQQQDAQAKPVVADSQSNANPQSATQNKDAQNKDAQNTQATAAQTTKDAAPNTSKDKDTIAKSPAPKAPHVITNEDIASPFGTNSETIGTYVSGAKSATGGSDNGKTSENKASAETWRSQIQAQKDAIAALQSQISSLSDSIQYAPGNCVSGCVNWNEQQKQKQDQVEAMKAQLGQLQQHLEEMQEAARQQGYGGSVYDP
jgi:hypothetical protein